MHPAASGADWVCPVGSFNGHTHSQIVPLLVFAAIFAAATFASAVLVSHFGSSGFFGHDRPDGRGRCGRRRAARPASDLPLDVIGKAILVAMATNPLCRAGIAILLGPPSFSAPFTSLTVAAGTTALPCTAFFPRYDERFHRRCGAGWRTISQPSSGRSTFGFQ